MVCVLCLCLQWFLGVLVCFTFYLFFFLKCGNIVFAKKEFCVFVCFECLKFFFFDRFIFVFLFLWFLCSCSFLLLLLLFVGIFSIICMHLKLTFMQDTLNSLLVATLLFPTKLLDPTHKNHEKPSKKKLPKSYTFCVGKKNIWKTLLIAILFAITCEVAKIHSGLLRRIHCTENSLHPAICSPCIHTVHSDWYGHVFRRTHLVYMYLARDV